MGIAADYASHYAPCEKCGVIRTPHCNCEINNLKDQLAQQAALLERALEVVRRYTDVYYQRSDSSLKVTAKKAQALIPDLEKALEKKP